MKIKHTLTPMKTKHTLTPMKTIIMSLGLAAALVSPVSATVVIDYITVADAGNAADATGYGAVGYTYQIGKYEVTNAQYGEFLNAKAATDSYGLYNSSMSSYGITRSGSNGSYTYAVTGALANRPVVYVSWYDAARFANWLVNGQGSGSTETGAYTIWSGNVWATPGAKFHIPTEDEWYKAAYYNGAGAYSLYPNGQDTITTEDANYAGSIGSQTDVGSYAGDPSAYGTYDQGGNVWEWTERVSGTTSRGLRGGGIFSNASHLSSAGINANNISYEGNSVGFRVASIAPVPEPSSWAIGMVLAGIGVLRRKRHV